MGAAIAVAKKSAPQRADRKRRTRRHVLADLSFYHVQFLIATAGFSSGESSRDYGYDLVANTFDTESLIDEGFLLIQLKATERLEVAPDLEYYTFDLDVRDHNLWIREPNPVVLILYDAQTNAAFGLFFQRDPPTPKPGAQSVRVKVPLRNRVDADFFRRAREWKAERLAPNRG
jgi:hypothetical protein